MTAIAGYQSDLNLQDIEFVGDFPLEHNLGGYGETTGATDDYVLTLDPAISQYRVGMHFQVKFNHANGGVSTLNVDTQGATPLMKPVGGILKDLDPNDLNTTSVYDIIYDGVCLQVVTGIDPALPNASEAQPGIAEIATQAEVDAGADNTKIVTPQKLLQFVSDKITGLWENKGFFDCSTNPNYPAAVSGDAYTVSVAGKIGGAAGIDVEVRDVFYCINDNPGGDQATVGGDWGIIQSNLVQATEVIAGIAEIATQAEVNAGLDDMRLVTALKLKTLLDGRNATEVQTGLAEIATQAEVNTGGDDSRFVTPLKLAVKIAAELAGKEDFLGNPSTNGYVLQSTIAGVRSWRATNRRLFTNYGTWGGSLGTGENDFGNTYTMPAGTLTGSGSLEINISGNFQLPQGNITLRVYIGNEVIFTYTGNIPGNWSIKIVGGRFNTNIFKGEAVLNHSNIAPGAVQIIQTAALAMDTTSQLIRITHQNAVSGLAQLNRSTFLIRHLV